MGNAPVAPGMAPMLAQPQIVAPGGPVKAGSFALGEHRSKSDIVTSSLGFNPAFQRSSSDIVTSSQMMRGLNNVGPSLPTISEQSPALAPRPPPAMPCAMPAPQAPIMQMPQPSLTPLETWPPALSAAGPRLPTAPPSFNLATMPSFNMGAKPMLAPAPAVAPLPMAPMMPVAPPMKRSEATVLSTFYNDQVRAASVPSASAGMRPYASAPAIPTYAQANNFVMPQASIGLNSYGSTSNLGFSSAVSPYVSPPTAAPTQLYGQAPSLGYQQPTAYSGFGSTYQQPFSYSTPTAPTTSGFGYASSTSIGFGQATALQLSGGYGQASYLQPQASVPQASYAQQASYLQPQASVPQASYAQQVPSLGYSGYTTPSVYQPSLSGFSSGYATQFQPSVPGFSSLSSYSAPTPYQAPSMPYSAASSAYGFVPPVQPTLISGSAMPSVVGSFAPSYSSSYAPSLSSTPLYGGGLSSGFQPQVYGTSRYF